MQAKNKEDISHPLTQQSWAWFDKIARHSEHQQNYDGTGEGETSKVCVYHLH